MDSLSLAEHTLLASTCKLAFKDQVLSTNITVAERSTTCIMLWNHSHGRPALDPRSDPTVIQLACYSAAYMHLRLYSLRWDQQL